MGHSTLPKLSETRRLWRGGGLRRPGHDVRNAHRSGWSRSVAWSSPRQELRCRRGRMCRSHQPGLRRSPSCIKTAALQRDRHHFGERGCAERDTDWRSRPHGHALPQGPPWKDPSRFDWEHPRRAECWRQGLRLFPGPRETGRT